MMLKGFMPVKWLRGNVAYKSYKTYKIYKTYKPH